MIHAELINIYLENVRNSIQKGHYTVKRIDLQNLYSMGISIAEMKHILCSLHYSEYVSGPSEDHLFPDQSVYVFGHHYETFEIYIKMTYQSEQQLFILSFHPAKYPLNYPLKIKEREK